LGSDQQGLSGARDRYAAAARAFAELVGRIPADRWDGPGLGDWDLRALVGHTSRSLTTVNTYLRSPATREDVPDAVAYYLWVRRYLASADGAEVVERGRAAGRELGEDPAGAVGALVDRVLGELAAVATDRLITVIAGQGMRVSAYLPTRVFELVVHGLDIARAAQLPFDPPAEALAEAAALAARVGVAAGQGAELLMALTGRAPLPPAFSVV